MTILGLDIGGANIKAADDTGRAVCRSFAIWRTPERLGDEITAILREFPRVDRIAITMTAELADCFSTKAEGVRFILDSVETSVKCHQTTEPARVDVWTTDGRFLEAAQAREFPAKVAAANWHALATWSAQFVPTGSALLVDIGTTTTDIIPLSEGKPIPAGLTDLARLLSGELSYSGVRRTPLCAVAHSVPFRDGYCSLAAELFATTLDVYLLTGEIPEDPHDLDTANGKPATRDAAWDRIVRMLCCDREEVSFASAVQIARFLADVQRQRLAGSFERVLHRLSSPCQSIIISGSGTFLARQLVSENRKTKNAKIVLLSDLCSPAIAEAACAYAVAKLSARDN